MAQYWIDSGAMAAYLAMRATAEQSFMQNRPSARGWVWVGLQFFLLGVVSLVGSYFIEEDQWIYHGFFCVAGTMIALLRFIKYRQVNFNVFLTEHRLMFLFSFTFYFLIGASLLAFGASDDIANRMMEYAVDAPFALKIDAINAIGFGIALTVSALTRPIWLPRMVYQIGLGANKINLFKAIVIMTIIGLCAKYYVISNDFSANPEIISGLWRNASMAPLVVILVGMIYQGKNQFGIRLIAGVMALSLSVLGLLEFNKSDFLLPVMMLVGGIAIRNNSKSIFLIGTVAGFVLLATVGGAVGYSRINISSIESTSLSDRLALVEAGLEAAKQQVDSANYSAWGRISYVNSQAAALDFYDRGIGGDDFSLIPWLFVPRVLAPNKPNLTSSGSDFYYKITGFEGSSTGQGIFANGYYNLGWLGLIISAMLCGWIVMQTSAIAERIIASKALLLYPMVFSGLFIAFRIDGNFLTDFLGVFIMISYFIFGLWLVMVVLRKKIR